MFIVSVLNLYETSLPIIAVNNSYSLHILWFLFKVNGGNFGIDT